MINRREFVLGLAVAVAMFVLRPAFAQTTTAADTKRGFLERPGCRVYYEVTDQGQRSSLPMGLAAIT